MCQPVPACASTIPDLPGDFDLNTVGEPHQLDGIHTATLRARFGVCENGAVWMDECELGPHRVLPFIAEHLFIVLNAVDLVANMHEAYARIGRIGKGFGLFLAGPSKTADIEQCLVVGAPRRTRRDRVRAWLSLPSSSRLLNSWPGAKMS